MGCCNSIHDSSIPYLMSLTPYVKRMLVIDETGASDVVKSSRWLIIIVPKTGYRREIVVVFALCSCFVRGVFVGIFLHVF